MKKDLEGKWLLNQIHPAVGQGAIRRHKELLQWIRASEQASWVQIKSGVTFSLACLQVGAWKALEPGALRKGLSHGAWS